MGYEFDKQTGKINETKPAIKSPTIWTGAGLIVIGFIEALPEIVEQVGPLLPPHALAIATATAGVIVIARRIFSENTQIKGIIKDD